VGHRRVVGNGVADLECISTASPNSGKLEYENMERTALVEVVGVLTGQELVRLVKETEINSLEDHIAVLYQMRSAELASGSQSILAAALAIAGLVGAAVFQPNPVNPIAPPSWQSVTALLLAFTVGGTGTLLALRSQAELRTQLPAAKHLANLLASRYRP
jgi:hypothetical protein